MLYNRLDLYRRFRTKPGNLMCSSDSHPFQQSCIRIHVGIGFADTAITWLDWVPNIQSLDIDTQILLQLTAHSFKIDRFLSLQALIVRQNEDSDSNEDPLLHINRLGVSSSLRSMRLHGCKVDSESIVDDFVFRIGQICHDMCKLEAMTIEFSKKALTVQEILPKLIGAEKKYYGLEHIHISSAYVQLWLKR